MLDPSELYEVADDLPEIGRPVLVEALTGVVDAGGAIRLARDHLLTTLDNRLIATFDVDQLLDYRSRRPFMIFVEDHWEHYDEPVLGLYLVDDSAGTPFLLLSGPEPDLQWKRFIAAVGALAQRLSVRLTVGLNAIPMAVPHTRPCGVTAHATRRDLIIGYEPWVRRVQVPSSAGHLMEYQRGRDGLDAMGFAAHVPHYLSQTDYPAATESLLTSLSKATGLMLPLDGLRSASAVVRGNIDRQLANGGEAAALVTALEEQYDTFIQGREGTGLPAATTEALPTADELAAALERFLAEQTEPDGPPDLPSG
ncbi:proteasome assembly chaperone family protein [Protofrankia symbiont of Coriaria ruscifolia]|uniref:proteasome assembly chaperone family protein n=1 Tax=Protofrankia symbiont of Coriaria ruscifolia TaxID=1306542 RepID=UPI0010410EC9|nr:PAC2 family protein [Protofrankia symbiont of Coriaria ruscifolia]